MIPGAATDVSIQWKYIWIPVVLCPYFLEILILSSKIIETQLVVAAPLLFTQMTSFGSVDIQKADMHLIGSIQQYARCEHPSSLTAALAHWVKLNLERWHGGASSLGIRSTLASSAALFPANLPRRLYVLSFPLWEPFVQRPRRLSAQTGWN